MYEDTFSLIAELSIGLAGFTGVAAAFGGRERAYQPIERVRLTAVFLISGGALAGCLAIHATAAAGFSAATQFQTAGTICFVITVCGLAVSGSKAIRETRNPESTASAGAVALNFGLTALCLVLYGMSVLQGGVPGPLVGGLSVQLLAGLWIFTRLLTRPN